MRDDPGRQPYDTAVLDLTRRRIEIFDGAGDDWRFAESLKSISEDTAQEYEGRAVLELVQNGHDALGHDVRGRIAVVLDLADAPGVLYVANQGAPFTNRNFRAITEFALSDKGAGEGIGNKGLGFRSVLQLTDWPEIYSKADPGSDRLDGYCFGFARRGDLDGLGLAPELLERVVEQVSPLALPVPARPEDPVLDELCRLGYSTVVRLPLRSPQAAAAARAQVEDLPRSDAPLLLFLERVTCLTAEIRTAGADPDRQELARHSDPSAVVPGADWVRDVDLGPAGTYLLATRALAQEPLADAISRSVEAREIDEKWSRWDGSGAWVGVAVRLDAPLDRGRLYTHLPMAEGAAAPLCAHAHAPFFTKLARLAISDTVRLNDHLLGELARLSADLLRAVRDAAPRELSAWLVPDLVCWDPPARLDAALEGRLVEEPAVPVFRGGWTAVGRAVEWADRPRPWTVLTRHAIAGLGVDVLDTAAVGEARRARLLALKAALAGRTMTPTAQTVAGWAERIAGGLPGPDRPGSRELWAAFYDDLQQAFAGSADALKGRRVVLDSAGTVRRALGGDARREDTLFFSPEQNDPAARVPSDLRALRSRIAFTHPDLPWSRTARAFFEAGQLVREYRADRVFDALRDLLAATKSDALRRDALAFAHRQFPALNSAQRVALRGVGLVVPRADGSWARASDSLFSPGWGADGAVRLGRFLAAGGEESEQARALRDRWIAAPDDWPGGAPDQAPYAEFLASVGVRDGLVPAALPAVPDRQGHQLVPAAVARQLGLPEQVATAWARDVAAVWQGGRHPYTQYSFAGRLSSLPAAADAAAMGPTARREYAELVARGLADWDDSAFAVTVWRPTRPVLQQDPNTWPTPLASALRHLPWLPVGPGDGGEQRFATPAQAWHAADGDLPAFVPALPAALRRLLAEPRALGRAVAAGLRLWEDPANAGQALRELGGALADGGVPDHLAASFRNHYARVLADAAERGDWPWAGNGRAVLAAVRDGRLEALPAEAGRLVYVPDEHAPLKQSLVELAGHPVLVADPAAGERAAALLADRGMRPVRMSQVDVRVYAGRGGPEIVPEPSRPLLADGRDWLVTLVALALELKSGTFVRRTERTLLGLLRQVRAVRVARLPDVEIAIGEVAAVPAPNVRSVPLPDPAHPTVAVWGAEGGWDELQACVPALAHLLGQPYLHDALELALIKLERLVDGDDGAEPDDGLLARALDTTPARVAELRRAAEGDLEQAKRLLRPVAAHLAGPDGRDAAVDAVDACATEQALADVLAAAAAAADRPGPAPPASETVALARGGASLSDLRDALGLPFDGFNSTLAALGPPYAPLTHPDLHDAAFAAFVDEHERAILERLRERYRPDAELHGAAPGYAKARTLDGLGPDPAWLPVHRAPGPELIGARVGAWLRDLGASGDLAAPPVLPPVDGLRAENARRLEDVVARAAPVVAAWCRAHAAALPPGWSGTPLVEAQFALDATGLADLVDVPEPVLLRAAADGAGWPDGMELTADARSLGLADADLAPPAGAAAPGRRAAPRTIRLGEVDLEVGPDNLARIAEAAMRTVGPELLAQSGRATLSELPAARGGGAGAGTRRTVVARDGSLTEDQRSAVGLIGEIAARAWLSARYRAVRWRSGYAALISGDPDASDSYGYDFDAEWRNTTLMFEVKAVAAERRGLVEFELGESEVRAAQANARNDRWRILLVTDVLEPQDRRVQVLPNPFSARGQGRFRVAGRGLRYQCAPS